MRLWPLGASISFAFHHREMNIKAYQDFTSQTWGEYCKSAMVDIWLRYLQKDTDRASEQIAIIRLNQPKLEYGHVKAYPPCRAKMRCFELVAVYSLIDVACLLMEYRRNTSVIQLEQDCNRYFNDAEFAIHAGGIVSLKRFLEIARRSTKEQINRLKGYYT